MPSAGVDPSQGLLQILQPSSNDGKLFQNELQIIHIRVYQRKSRKYVTTIEGLPSELNLKRVVKFMKKNFSCSGVIKTQTKNDIEKKIVQLSGDQRDNIENFIIGQKIAVKEQIKIHGF